MTDSTRVTSGKNQQEFLTPEPPQISQEYVAGVPTELHRTRAEVRMEKAEVERLKGLFACTCRWLDAAAMVRIAEDGRECLIVVKPAATKTRGDTQNKWTRCA